MKLVFELEFSLINVIYYLYSTFQSAVYYLSTRNESTSLSCSYLAIPTSIHLDDF